MWIKFHLNLSEKDLRNYLTGKTFLKKGTVKLLNGKGVRVEKKTEKC